MMPTNDDDDKWGEFVCLWGQAGEKERKSEGRMATTQHQLVGKNTDNLARHANKLQTSELCFLILNCIL